MVSNWDKLWEKRGDADKNYSGDRAKYIDDQDRFIDEVKVVFYRMKYKLEAIKKVINEGIVSEHAFNRIEEELGK